jgi:hypothetical protein
MVTAIYNKTARAFGAFRNKSARATNKFSIRPTEIQQEIFNDQLMDNVNILNPIEDIKTQSRVSHAGTGGRSSQTFVVDDRKFTVDSLGIISEATVDNSDVAVNAILSFNPNIDNLYGMCKPGDPKTLDPASILSVTGALVPGATNDDGQDLFE